MKLLALVSSCRKNGNTARMVELIATQIKEIAALQKITVDFETIYLGEVSLNACKGCRVCFDKGETFCPFKDDLLTLKKEMNAADGILLASPVYVEDINGVMKNLIDRLAFVCHRPEFAGKAAYLIVTSGAGSSNHAPTTMNRALHTWGFSIIGQSKFRTGALMESAEMKALYQNKTQQIAAQILKTVNAGKTFKPSLMSLLMFKVQQHYMGQAEKQSAIDYRYWLNKGWLEPGCRYYIPCRSNFIKTGLARMAGKIIPKFLR
jgi:Multimeric flavodoxin WrbA